MISNRRLQMDSGLRPQPKGSSGLSLLEVVLALAILAVATAYLASTMEQATTNGLKSQKLTQAELVAESIVNQIIAGVIPSDPVSWTPYSNSRGPTEWVYQIQQVPTELESMVGFQVAVQQVNTGQAVVPTTTDLFANRWIIDPELQLDVPPEEEGYGDEGYGSEGTGGTTSSSGSTGSTGGAQAAGAGAALGGAGGGGFGPGGPGGGGGRGAAGGGGGGRGAAGGGGGGGRGAAGGGGGGRGAAGGGGGRGGRG
ncbi:MAG: prepilin-type N-terminal cleavage/methylation domain-containing protein [Pirellulaceae bacterium]